MNASTRRVALPHGATRDDVKLMVTPFNNDLRVIIFAEDHRTVSKAVHLPRDALFTDISAAFTPDTVASNKEREGVSSLEITVGRVLPKSIDIK